MSKYEEFQNLVELVHKTWAEILTTHVQNDDLDWVDAESLAEEHDFDGELHDAFVSAGFVWDTERGDWIIPHEEVNDESELNKQNNQDYNESRGV